ncbi:MAG: amidohydrolase family protein, partial [Kiritimatiellae bacterium]|nr:amidohydrolase family protein [Kiritimatiellia bacterium]
ARAFPDKLFIFPHAGGYLINDFMKICHFQANIWMDFSFTHTNYGGISKNPLPLVEDCIGYALKSKFNDRLLLGSDYPFFAQEAVFDYYREHNALGMLNDNFLKLCDLFMIKSS